MSDATSANDAALLRAMAATGSQQAYAELAGRYVDFIYAAARRQVGDEHLAADVTQAVLLLLWQKGASVRPGALAAWLHTTTRYAAANALKTRDRRAFHERAAAVGRTEAAVASPAHEEDATPTPNCGRNWTARSRRSA